MRKFIFSLGFMAVSLTALAEDGREYLNKQQEYDNAK